MKTTRCKILCKFDFNARTSNIKESDPKNFGEVLDVSLTSLCWNMRDLLSSSSWKDGTKPSYVLIFNNPPPNQKNNKEQVLKNKDRTWNRSKHLVLHHFVPFNPSSSASKTNENKGDDCKEVTGYPGNNNKGMARQIRFATQLPWLIPRAHVCDGHKLHVF